MHASRLLAPDLRWWWIVPFAVTAAFVAAAIGYSVDVLPGREYVLF
jgi:hypothetical protein